MQAGLTWLLMQTLLLGSGMILLRMQRAVPPSVHRWAWPALLWLSVFLPTVRGWPPAGTAAAWPAPAWWAEWHLPAVTLRAGMLAGAVYLVGFGWRLALWMRRTDFQFAFRQNGPRGFAFVLAPPLPQLLMDTGCMLLWFHPLAQPCRRYWLRLSRRPAVRKQAPHTFWLAAGSWLVGGWLCVTQPALREAGSRHLDAPTAEWLATPILELGTPTPPDTLPWHLRWGPLDLALERGPDGRLLGDHTVLASDWARIGHEAPRLFHGETELAVHDFQVTLWHEDLGAVQATSWLPRQGRQPPSDAQAGLVGWQLFLRAEGAVVHPLVVHVANPDALYYPPVPLPEMPTDEARWPFQIVSLPAGKTIVRLDTTVASARRLLEVYADTTRYTLLHIPGFRTRQRFVGEQEDLFAGRRKTAGLHLLPPIDYLQLREYDVPDSAFLGLWIGNLCAAPELGLIRPQEWQGEAWRIQAGKQTLEVAQAQLIVVRPGATPVAYWLAGGLEDAFARMRQAEPAPASFYFQNLVVRDAQGMLRHLPRAFAFHTAAQGMWAAQVAPSIEALPVPPLRFDTTLTFEGRLGALLVEACAQRPNRIELPERLADLRLACRIQLDRAALPAWRRILLETLRKHLALHIGRAWRRPDNHYALIADDEALLSRFAADDALQREMARVLALESPWYEPLGPLTLEALGEVLEARFGIYVSLWRPPSGKYWFALPTHELDQTIEVLRQQYGLSLEPTFRPLHLVVVKSPDGLTSLR